MRRGLLRPINVNALIVYMWHKTVIDTVEWTLELQQLACSNTCYGSFTLINSQKIHADIISNACHIIITSAFSKDVFSCRLWVDFLLFLVSRHMWWVALLRSDTLKNRFFFRHFLSTFFLMSLWSRKNANPALQTKTTIAQRSLDVWLFVSLAT